MDAIVKPWPRQVLSDHVRAAPKPPENRPTREQAEAAVRTLIAYVGDDPDREGVLETPKRVVGAFEEFSTARFPRWAPTTISCWCATSISPRIASIT
jgi:hypothetical protein